MNIFDILGLIFNIIGIALSITSIVVASRIPNAIKKHIMNESLSMQLDNIIETISILQEKIKIKLSETKRWKKNDFFVEFSGVVCCLNQYSQFMSKSDRKKINVLNNQFDLLTQTKNDEWLDLKEAINLLNEYYSTMYAIYVTRDTYINNILKLGEKNNEKKSDS